MASFSPVLEETIHRALTLASDRKHELATLEHLLLALLDDNDAAAVISACGPGLGEVVPSPAILPSFTTMAPTGGRGPTIPIAEEARSRARIKVASSLFMMS